MKRRELIRIIRQPDHIEPACDWLRQAALQYLEGGPIQIKLMRAESKRSIAQNRLLWMWNGCIQAHMRDHYGQIASADDWHEVMVDRLCPPEVKVLRLPDGHKAVAGRTRTSTMGVKEMARYLDLLDGYCAEYLQLRLPQPDDLYWAALMKDK